MKIPPHNETSHWDGSTLQQIEDNPRNNLVISGKFQETASLELSPEQTEICLPPKVQRETENSKDTADPAQRESLMNH